MDNFQKNIKNVPGMTGKKYSKLGKIMQSFQLKWKMR